MRFVVALFASAIALASPATLWSQGPLASFAIENVTIVDLEEGALVPGQTVIVVGNEITTLGPATRVGSTPAMRIIDGRGRFLMPGMWEMHAHALQHYGVDYNYGMEAFQLFIANGVTGLRDMGSSMDQLIAGRKRIADLGVAAPRIFGSGPILEGNANSRFAPLTKVVDTPQTGRLAVTALQESGVDFLKIHDALTRETYFAVTEEAAIRGIAFAGHVPDDVTIVEASNAGQVSIEHLRFLTEYCTLDGEIDRERCEAGIHQLWLNGTFLGPTLVGAAPLRADDPRVAEERLQYVKDWKRATWNPLDNEVSAERQTSYEQSQRLTQMASEGGVRLILSTDTGGGYRLPGFAAVDEVIELVEAGVSPLEALRAAAFYPVLSLDLQHALGTIEAGKLADMILLDGNPLTDIRNLTRIAAVISDGRVFEGAERDALLNSVRASASTP